MANIYLCLNCKGQISTAAKYCKYCATKELREKMKEDNDRIQTELKIKEAKGLLPWQKDEQKQETGHEEAVTVGSEGNKISAESGGSSTGNV